MWKMWIIPPYASQIGLDWPVLNGINFEYNKKGF